MDAARVLRTPEARFADLPDYPFAPHYLDIDGLRMHYLDEGPKHGDIVLMLHGEPSWSYLYRKVIPPVTAAGYRVVAPDLIGFGRSDKLVRQRDYSAGFHVASIRTLIDTLSLDGITLLCQDWGGLIGLRVAMAEQARFRGIVAANTMLPGFPRHHPNLVGRFTDRDLLRAAAGFGAWFAFSQLYPFWKASDVLRLGTTRRMSEATRAAYDAPFPGREYMAGARVFPRLVPTDRKANRETWQQLLAWQKPFLCAFSDRDPIMSPLAPIFELLVPGAADQPHTTVGDAGHFLQEDQGEALADILVGFMRYNECAGISGRTGGERP